MYELQGRTASKVNTDVLMRRCRGYFNFTVVGFIFMAEFEAEFIANIIYYCSHYYCCIMFISFADLMGYSLYFMVKSIYVSFSLSK